MRFRSVLTALSLVPLASIVACVPRQEPPPPPPPAPSPVSPVPSPLPAGSDWRDWPPTPGTWTYRRDSRGSLALFGQPGADAVLTLRCDRAARQLYLARAGTGQAPLTIRTSSVTRALPVRSTGDSPAYVATVLTPRDPLLDAMAFSRGRFTIEQAGMTPLVIPAWAEIGRTIEDCRG